jgi:hypothetical protein
MPAIDARPPPLALLSLWMVAGSIAECRAILWVSHRHLASPHGSMVRVDAPVPAKIGASTRSSRCAELLYGSAIGDRRVATDGQGGVSDPPV